MTTFRNSPFRSLGSTFLNIVKICNDNAIYKQDMKTSQIHHL